MLQEGLGIMQYKVKLSALAAQENIEAYLMCPSFAWLHIV